MKRWLLVAVRKADLCKCGCRGWCSLYVMLHMLGWSIAALARGEHPHLAQFGDVLDALRAALAGTPLGFLVAVLYVKGDWMEVASSLGFPNWVHLIHPCPLCWSPLADIALLRGFSALTLPWVLKTWLHYCAACDACEIVLDPLPRALWRKLRASLAYDKRTHTGAAHGRALEVDFPEVGLRRGDRLEPSTHCPDVGAGFDADCPQSVTFWRPSAETLTHHRNPLFAEETGVTPDRVLVVDWLHTGPLGVLKYFLAWLVWELITLNVWNAPRDPMVTRLQVSTLRLRQELFAWYTAEARAGRDHCRVQDLTFAMLGSHDDPKLNLHAAEMVGFLHFAKCLLDRYGASLLGRYTAAARVQAGLQRIHELLKQYPMRTSDVGVQELVDNSRMALRSLIELGIDTRFKMHALVHMCYDAHEKGSPALWATWTDEGLNKLLKAVSLAAHCRRDVWTERVLDSVQAVLDRMGRKRKLHN